MILVDDLSGILPAQKSGKIVGIATHRSGDYMIVACEHGLYRLWDDGTGYPQVTPEIESPGG